MYQFPGKSFISRKGIIIQGLHFLGNPGSRQACICITGQSTGCSCWPRKESVTFGRWFSCVLVPIVITLVNGFRMDLHMVLQRLKIQSSCIRARACIIARRKAELYGTILILRWNGGSKISSFRKGCRSSRPKGCSRKSLILAEPE